MMRSLLFALALTLGLAAPLWAQNAKPAALAEPIEGPAPALPKPELKPDGSYSVKVPLTSLTPVKNVTLKGSQAYFSFSLPVPERWEVRSASLTFGYVNSTALLGKLSRLAFSVSGRTLGQVELRPESPKGRVEIPIPGNLLTTGYNECTFSAAQSYTEEYAENPTHPSLWTTVELDNAVVEMNYVLKAAPMRLSSIADTLFDSRSFLGADVNIVLPEFTETTLKHAAMAASGVALRLDYQAARCKVSNELKPGMDNILIGDTAFVQRVLGPRAPRTGDSTVAILPGLSLLRPGAPDPQYATIVLTGGPEGVERAVRAFSYLSFPFPDTPSMEVTQVQDPEPAMLDITRTISRDKEYTLRSLGYSTKTYKGGLTGTPSIDLPFTFPSGLDLNPNSYVSLSLHLAYAPGMRQDSVLTIFINGIYVGGVHFDDIKGGTFLDYRINLPLYAMKKGSNVITLTPVLTPLKTHLGEFYQTDNLLVTLFDDSTLTFPDLPMWAKLPDLAMFWQDAFPYSLMPDMRDTCLLIGDKHPATLDAAVNLVAQLSQRTGLPPLKMTTSFGPSAEGNIIAVGPVEALPRAIVEAAPFSMLPKGKRPFPLMPKPKPQEDAAAAHKAPLWSKFLPILYEKERGHSEINQYLWADVRTGAGLTTGKGFVSQFKTPGSQASSVTMFTGATPQDVGQLVNRMWEPAVRSMISGDLSMVDLTARKATVTSLEIGDKYYIGKLGSMPKLTILVNTYPWTSLGVLVALLAALALLCRRMLKAYNARRR